MRYRPLEAILDVALLNQKELARRAA